MLKGAVHTVETLLSRFRRLTATWWGGIGCRVAFIMLLAVFLVTMLVGVFFVWEGRRVQEERVRDEALMIGRFLSRVAPEVIARPDGPSRENLTAFFPGAEKATEPGLLYLGIYDREGRLLYWKARSGMPEEERQIAGSAGIAGMPLVEPKFRFLAGENCEVLLPVRREARTIGYIRAGVISDSRVTRSGIFTKQTVLMAASVLFLAFLFSQIIAAGIVKPISQLSSAVDDLGTRSWRVPLPVRGRDEISKLANAFNQMALALHQREMSLSHGNRDLFILHTSGLDLMESLDLATLMEKVAARAEDLVKAETTTVASVDRAERRLRYLGVQGNKARQLQDQDVPFEAAGIFNWIASYGTPLLIQNAADDFRLDGGRMQLLGITSLMAVPLWSSNTMIAILTAVNKKGGDPFDRHDLRLFTVFANIVGAAVQNAFLYADLKHKVAELNSTHQQLVHSSKMAAIGELAANLAHEINNPLTSVLGYTSHLLKSPQMPEESLRKLRMMEQETLRVRKIIRNLLDFSRQRTSPMRPGDLLQPLRETVLLLQGAAERGGVHIIEEYLVPGAVVNMDHNELKQVFINIMNNALYAMPAGGELRVRVNAPGDREIEVVFTDTGGGISEEHLGKIFEPFFSTKGMGDGTGLGLSISYRIIQSHGGRIEVASTMGRGSIFRIVLPMHEIPVVKE